MTFFFQYNSPLGKLLLTSDGLALTGLWFDRPLPDANEESDLAIFRQACAWLDSYFSGEDPSPGSLALAPEGTGFQKEVWAILFRIPKGQLTTYGEIAREIAAARGIEKMSAQAVGQAVGRNPINIIIPCHRVVGSNGKLTGYTGGLDKKIRLLLHEGHHYEEETL